MSKAIKEMDFKELRDEVQRLNDALAIMQRKYEDILYNLDDENFSGSLIKEKNGMKAQIEINENEIKTKVSTEDFESEKIQTAQKIASKVSYDDFYSEIQQTASAIEMEVSRAITTKFVATELPKYPTDEQKKAFCECNGTLYYWNRISRDWEQARYSDGIKSQFLQTADGFELTGDVSISGDLIAGGTITGTAFSSSDGKYVLVLRDSAHLHNFALYNEHYKYSPTGDDHGTPFFSIYDTSFGGIGLFVAGECFLGARVSGDEVTVTPYGTWDFSHDGVEVIGIGGGEATFG